jgi:2-polyprenyl-6-methoxyphenol hydroxylase-like FAD-dependent oxidoreductase
METIEVRAEPGPADVPVLIVGAGPAGLVTGIGLARQGDARDQVDRRLGEHRRREQCRDAENFAKLDWNVMVHLYLTT